MNRDNQFHCRDRITGNSKTQEKKQYLCLISYRRRRLGLSRLSLPDARP